MEIRCKSRESEVKGVRKKMKKLHVESSPSRKDEMAQFGHHSMWPVCVISSFRHQCAFFREISHLNEK